MWKSLQTKNPEKEYPSNLGAKWSNEEETLLLEALSKNTDIEMIAQKHNRTTGGIHCRLRDIAYRLYLKNISMDEIMKITKLDEEYITQSIERKQNYTSKKEKMKETLTKTHSSELSSSAVRCAECSRTSEAISKEFIAIESEIVEMKTDIKDLKNSVKELVVMIKAIYEFEDA